MNQNMMPRKKPKGVVRWFLRMPIWIYRLNMGWMMGSRFVMLIHTGRKSGLPRYAVIEVLHHDKERNVYTVASGWGKQSDWYRNILKNPAVRLVTQKGQYNARAVVLPVLEGALMFQDYAQRNPTAFRTLAKFLLNPDVDLQQIDMADVAEMMPVVRLVPDNSGEMA